MEEHDVLTDEPGLNQLKGFTVEKFFIMYPPVNGYGMNGTVIIPNASVMTIPLVILFLFLYITSPFSMMLTQRNRAT